MTRPRPSRPPAQRGAPGEPPAGVGRTALGAAIFRAIESRRADRLFADPYAAAFLAAAPAVLHRANRGTLARLGIATGAAFQTHVVIRTRFFDDYLLAAAAAGVRQLVLVAAGLDTRAYRLAWPAGCRLFEVDLPEVLEFKHRVLAARAAVPSCDRRPVPADLREDWTTPLVAAGLHPDQPTGWLLEGLLSYLSAGEAEALLRAVGRLSAAGSRLACEAGDPGAGELRERARATPAVAEFARLWRGGLPDPAGWLTDQGWRVSHHDGAAVTAGYQRTVPGPVAGGGFLTAVRPSTAPPPVGGQSTGAGPAAGSGRPRRK
ncbi:MAG TPA: SAM-dependent methyltransferase [Natronosporangium sp.]